MSPLTTHLFRFATPARREEVWAALTSSEPGGGYLPGLSFVSDWAAGSTLVVMTADNVAVSFGEVIAAELPRRLSYALDGGRGPATYVTWEIRPMPTGRSSGCTSTSSTAMANPTSRTSGSRSSPAFS
jgi:hypothetical protein